MHDITPERVCQVLERLEPDFAFTTDLDIKLEKYEELFDLVYKFCHIANCYDSRCNKDHQNWIQEFKVIEEEQILNNK